MRFPMWLLDSRPTQRETDRQASHDKEKPTKRESGGQAKSGGAIDQLDRQSLATRSTIIIVWFCSLASANVCGLRSYTAFGKVEMRV